MARRGKRSQGQKPCKPYTVLGAGRLCSSLWKAGEERCGWTYRFNIYRMAADNGHVSQFLRPSDVESLAKLCQVLAATLSDDGCLPEVQRHALSALAN